MQGLIPLLLSYLSPEHCSATQTSAGDFLKAIITISANATTQDQNVIGPNELTRELVSEQCVQSLIDNMLRGGNPLTVGVGIVIEVIRKNNSDYDLDNQTGPVPKSSDPIYLGTLLRQFAKHVPDFMELILNPNHRVLNSDGTTTTRRRELKAAFGGKIEPLGFDRFKTCELMAELLHCSNMALLNERGSEAEVKRRDTERERLKAEGKLQPSKETPANEFGTSVDSSGFHHARAPSDSSESPEEIKKLEVSNSNEEEDFEKVTSSEAFAEDVRDDYGEKDGLIGEPLSRSPKVMPRTFGTGEHFDMTVEPLSPRRDHHVSHDRSTTDIPARHSPLSTGEQAASPTATDLTDQVSGLELDQDAIMTHSPPQYSEADRANSNAAPVISSSKPHESILAQELSRLSVSDNSAQSDALSPHPDDKPAPLFSGRTPGQQALVHETDTAVTRSETEESAETTHAGDADSPRSVALAGNDEMYNAHYEVDIDGSPVVGDLLKMMFVEHRVVPTILVSPITRVL